jgi:hypothetical protein
MPINQQSFFQLATSNWTGISRWTAGFALTASAFGASTDVVEWWQGGELGPVAWGYAGLQILMIFGTIYLAASDIMGRRPSFLGFLRFITATVILLLPIAATFGVLLLFKSLMSEGVRLAIFLIGLFSGLAFITLLPAWPLAQAAQATFVSPLSVFRATRGHRGGLIFISFALGAINKADFIPKMQPANSVGEVVLIATGQTLMSLISIALTAIIAATALQFATRNDASLDG